MNTKTYSPILEFRQYTLHPDQREVLIELFDREFVETQKAVGIQVIGQFRDLDDSNRFVWLRGFNDMSGRAQSLHAFYSGPIWAKHRDAANATMIDSDNVLLLHPANSSSGFALKNERRLPPSDLAKRDGLVSATIYFFNRPVEANFIHYFENTIHPELMEAGIKLLAYFVTEDSPNTYPKLPVREGEYVFVWFAGYQDQTEYERSNAKLSKSKVWNEDISRFLKKHFKGKPETLKLSPTSRSRLTGI